MSIQTNSPSTNLGTSLGADGIAQLLGYADAATMVAAIAAGPQLIALCAKTATQAIGAATEVQIVWETTGLYHGATYSAGAITLAEAGTYRITALVGFTGSIGAPEVYINNVTGSPVQMQINRAFSNKVGLGISWAGALSAGAKVAVATYSVSGHTVNYNSAGRPVCYWIIERII
jgi:hypothetical protein